AATPADRKTRLVVYIHGFNNSFDDVITRAHRLSEIAGGAPVVAIDWTSGSKAQAYAQDLGNAAWSLDDVEALLRLLGGLSDRITIVAHSMGSQVALNALARIDRPLAANERWLAAIDRRPDLTVQQRREFHAEADADARTAAAFQGIVLASPDFDRGQAIGPQGAIDRALSPGQGLKRGMVVYTSASDAAIRAADHAYGYARLGTTRCRGDAEFARAQSAWQNGCHLNPPRDRLAVVDTGFVKPLLGTTMANRTRHTDFLDSTEVADDLAHVLQDGAPGGRRVRCAQTIGGTRREAWYIRPDGADAHEIARKACPTDSLPAPRNR
ncbi:MAG: alpha/beta hydrolase, partial [Sphingomonadales bacterium]|nr:alpha/beta hydrolase [Sphingomonadales bacterium]